MTRDEMRKIDEEAAVIRAEGADRFGPLPAFLGQREEVGEEGCYACLKCGNAKPLPDICCGQPMRRMEGPWNSIQDGRLSFQGSPGGDLAGGWDDGGGAGSGVVSASPGRPAPGEVEEIRSAGYSAVPSVTFLRGGGGSSSPGRPDAGEGEGGEPWGDNRRVPVATLLQCVPMWNQRDARRWALRDGIADAFRDVLAFHRKFNQAIGTTPAVPEERSLQLRHSLIGEEFNELLHAMGTDDLPAIADSACDLIYVVLGTLVSYGIDPAPVWAAIHAANLSKSQDKRGDGKVMKGPGFQHPDVAGILAGQRSLEEIES